MRTRFRLIIIVWLFTSFGVVFTFIRNAMIASGVDPLDAHTHVFEPSFEFLMIWLFGATIVFCTGFLLFCKMFNRVKRKRQTIHFITSYRCISRQCEQEG